MMLVLKITLLIWCVPLASNKLIDLIKQNCYYNITASKLNADYIIGAIFPINVKSRNASYGISLPGMFWSETIIYGVDLINNHSKLLPGVTLGYDVHDSCASNVDLVIHKSLDFMTDRKYWSSTNNNVTMSYNSHITNECPCDMGRSKLVAVIGTGSDKSSEVMCKLINYDHLPLVSYAASSDTLLENKNFMRTIPSSKDAIQVIIGLINHFKWNFISAIAYDNELGRSYITNLREELKKLNKCLAFQYLFETLNETHTIVSNLKELQNKSKIVILWSPDEDGLQITKAAHASNLKLIWITEIKEDIEFYSPTYLQGSFVIRLSQTPLEPFLEHLSNIKYNSIKNPWLKKVWDDIGFYPEYYSKKYTRNVLATLYAIAHGLHATLKCNTTMCARKNQTIDHDLLFHNIKMSTFQIGGQIYNLSNPLQEKSYNIKQIQAVEGSTRNNIMKIGTFNGDTKKLTINNSKIRWSVYNQPIAKCYRDCRRGEKVVRGSSPCCWKCIQCEAHTISTHSNQNHCTKCLQTEISNPNATRCLPLKNVNISLYNTMTDQILLTVTIIGLAVTLTVFCTFVKYWNTPIVKSSNREMSIIQLVSILLLFASVSLYYMELTVQVCMLQNLSFGTFYSIIISFIVVKTYRLLCVFQEHRFSKVSRFLENKYQILLTLIPVAILAIYIIIWYEVYEVEIGIESFVETKTYICYCKIKMTSSNSDIENHIIKFALIAFLFCLSLFTGFMAYRARGLPQNFNEAQYICYAMFTSCVIWLLFIFIYLSQEGTSQLFSFLLVNAINNICLLVILYGYKVVLIIFYPHLNTKSHFQKLAKNATVATFIKEADPNLSNSRPGKVSVISFDFDDMFNEYKNNGSRSQRVKHFPSKVLARISTMRKSRRTKPNNYHGNQRSGGATKVDIHPIHMSTVDVNKHRDDVTSTLNEQPQQQSFPRQQSREEDDNIKNDKKRACAQDTNANFENSKNLLTCSNSLMQLISDEDKKRQEKLKKKRHKSAIEFSPSHSIEPNHFEDVTSM